MKFNDTHLRLRADQIRIDGTHVQEVLPKVFVTSLLEEPSRHSSWQALTDLELNAKVVPEGNLFRLRGTLQVTVSYPCVRCTQDVVIQLVSPLDIKLMAGEEPQIDEKDMFELEEDGGEEDAFVYFQDGTMDLVALVREQLFLDLPIYPSCEDSTAQQQIPCQFEPILVGPTPDAVWEDPVKAQLRALKDMNRS